MSAILVYPQPEGFDPRRFFTDLARSRRCGPVRRRAWSRIHFDTFDWRLHRARRRLAVVEAEGRRELRWRHADGSLLAARPIDRAPGFAAEIGDPEVAEAVADPAGIRRLLAQVTVDAVERIVAVYGTDDKTVCRVASVDRRACRDGATAESLAPVVEVRPLTGYDAARDEVAAWVAEQLAVRPLPATELEVALAAFGHTPGDYRSKQPSPVLPGMRAGDALRAFLLQMADTMERNVDGTRRGLDAEFLHDFRVAVRRTRSALGQLEGVLRKDAVAPFVEGFRWLGEVTGPCRDLDVMAIEIDDHMANLAPPLRHDLAPLRAFLQTSRREQRAQVAAALASARWRQLNAGWRRRLASEDAWAEDSARPVEPLAAARLDKLAKRLARRGARIDAATPVAELHRIRIDGKKLRYLLELFRPLLPAAPAAKLIKRLKRLQDRLGGWHDREQQLLLIQDAAERMGERAPAPPATLIAVSRLLAELERIAAHERRLVVEAVAALLPRLGKPARATWMPSPKAAADEDRR